MGGSQVVYFQVLDHRLIQKLDCHGLMTMMMIARCEIE